jgi:hypothetical protein
MKNPQPSAWSAALTRRKALAGAAGLAAGVTTKRAGAQETPPEPAADDAERIFTMFVQTAQGGYFLPKPGEEGVYQLVLRGASAQTIHFSDRPQRLVGSISTADFLANLGFSPGNPPNAAIVAETDQGQDVVVVELFNPSWDAPNQVLTYDLVVLDDYEGDGFGDLVQLADPELPETFGHTSLFIDDCPDIITCEHFGVIVGPIPGAPIRLCGFLCMPCDSYITPYEQGQRCAEAYPDKCNFTGLWWTCTGSTESRTPPPYIPPSPRG